MKLFEKLFWNYFEFKIPRFLSCQHVSDATKIRNFSISRSRRSRQKNWLPSQESHRRRWQLPWKVARVNTALFFHQSNLRWKVRPTVNCPYLQRFYNIDSLGLEKIFGTGANLWAANFFIVYNISFFVPRRFLCATKILSVICCL